MGLSKRRGGSSGRSQCETTGASTSHTPASTARARARSARNGKAEQEQDAVVGEDDREPAVELAQQQAEQGDQHRPRDQPGDGDPRSRPRNGVRPPVSRASVTPASTAKSAEARPPGDEVREGLLPVGVREASMWVATIPSSARQRATSSPTSRAASRAPRVRSRRAACRRRRGVRPRPCRSPSP